MRNKAFVIFLMICGNCLISAPAFAHHGASRWDVDTWGTISGTVKEFDWQNPHPLLLLDVKNDKGAVETWAVEFHPPNVMSRGLGWNHSTFKQGDQVTIYGHPEKKSVPVVNGMKSLRPVKVTMPGGQEVTVDPPGY
ncbi:MAG TPA: DUF6152 family protein [Candidatus Acidoferrales bacterium]|nr:DUF6152 family protein [Candidatus Acidoferrales bacterium]